MHTNIEKAISGAALQPLSLEQKRELVLLARSVFVRQSKIDTRHSAFGTHEFDAWRRRECMLTVERPGLTACRNEDYLPLKAQDRKSVV
jgi:hypothetical protein